MRTSCLQLESQHGKHRGWGRLGGCQLISPAVSTLQKQCWHRGDHAGMLTHRTGWWQQGYKTPRLHLQAPCLKKQSLGSSFCVLHLLSLLDLTPGGFTPSIHTAARAAGPLHWLCLEPPGLHRPFPNCISQGFGPLSLAVMALLSSTGVYKAPLLLLQLPVGLLLEFSLALVHLCLMGDAEPEKRAPAASLGVAVQGTIGSPSSLEDAAQCQQSLL